MNCPNCNQEEATFVEHYVGEDFWLTCDLCGAKTDDEELARAQTGNA